MTGSARARQRGRPALFRPQFEPLERRFALAVANAGADLDTSLGGAITLDAQASTGEGQLHYRWTQVAGLDVTGGSGKLTGVAPSFSAPVRVSTLEFELVVIDALGQSPPDRVVISVLEDHQNALFVSPTGSDTNPGTRAAPLRDLRTALTTALAGGDDLYVAAGEYSGSISLATGVSIYGGFDPSNWRRDPLNFESRIVGGPTAVTGNATMNVVLDGLSIVAADAALAGGSSTAVLLIDAVNVEIAGSTIEAGRGAGGEAGPAALPHVPPMADNGNNGQNGCEAATGCGAGGAQTAGSDFGGKGGNGGFDFSSGQAGSPGSGGAPGGAGGPGSNCFGGGRNGGNGSGGANGAAGQAGSISANFGQVNENGVYQPPTAGAGTQGASGKGGGGGGGGGGGDNGPAGVCNSDKGGGGGSGGSGGLGGMAGGGGKGGGGSLGVLLIRGTGIWIHDNFITTDDGGNGGRGADGGAGQQGGAGGVGGSGNDDSGPGGTGGRGGNGGAGGPGAGGAGGPSIGLFSNAADGGLTSNNFFGLGSAGTGGSGGTNSAGVLGPSGPTGRMSEGVGIGSGSSPLGVALALGPVYENQPVDTVVGTLSVINSAAGQPFSFSLAAGIGDDNNPSFKIEGDQLKLAHPLDFEARPIQRIRVRASGGAATIERLLSIAILNNNDPPTCSVVTLDATTDEAGPQIVADFVAGCSPGSPAESLQQLDISIETDDLSLFSVPPSLDGNGTLTYDPAPNVRGTANITVTIQDTGGTANFGADMTTHVIRLDVTKPHPWRNTARPLDVLADNNVLARDALEIINYLNAFGPGVLPARETIEPPFYDVNGDGNITSRDVADVINAINAGLEGAGLGEGEAARVPTISADAEFRLTDLLALLTLDAAEQGLRPRRLKP